MAGSPCKSLEVRRLCVRVFAPSFLPRLRANFARSASNWTPQATYGESLRRPKIGSDFLAAAIPPRGPPQPWPPRRKPRPPSLPFKESNQQLQSGEPKSRYFLDKIG